jgi:protein TonB
MLGVALLHLLAVLALIRAFAPDFTNAVVDRALATFTVTVTTPKPTPSATPSPDPNPVSDEGAAAEEGRKATPREVTAPKPKVALPTLPAPRASSTGTQDNSGAKEQGEGTGAGGVGNGTGSGRGGSGGGGMPARKLEKIAGDINSAKDYPKKTRDLRIGHSVTVLLTVATDGRVADCRVTAPSPDAEADAITCRLAVERFRFRPAADANGNPVIGKYAWRQRWFY